MTTTDLIPEPVDLSHVHEPGKGGSRRGALLTPAIVRRALVDSVKKLHPRTQVRNPVMFVVFVGGLLTTYLFVRDLPGAKASDSVFTGLVAIWLWFTVLFANFAEAVAEGRGKAQADTLRKTRSETPAQLLLDDGSTIDRLSTELHVGDCVVVTAGEFIPGDGDVIEGIASVDESAITGESAPVIRESGRRSLRGDWRNTRPVGPHRRTDLRGARRELHRPHDRPGRGRQPAEDAERDRAQHSAGRIEHRAPARDGDDPAVREVLERDSRRSPFSVALLVCLIPTTIGALLSAIGIAGMDRLVQRNVLAMSGRAVEAAGDVATLLLDKTGTITYGNRMAAAFLPVGGVDDRDVASVALLSSLADETPEGRSIVDLAEGRYSLPPENIDDAELVPFTAQTRMSGIEWHHRSIRKGAADAVVRWVEEHGGHVPADLAAIVEGIAQGGGTPLVVAENTHVLGVIHLKDTVKTGISERFAEMRAIGIRTVMITGDNPLTAATIAKEAGVDDFMAEATPEDKLARIRAEQAGGCLVAMTGDGTNDAPALAQADVGVAMNTGTQAAKEAGNMVDLDSDPTKLMDIVEIGKQMLITRGSLTTFSIANDVAKYFAIIPAMFVGVFPQLRTLNIMHLANPHSAILSAVIFNAIVIVALIPLALRGVKFRAMNAASILRRNLMIYGVGGIIAPFVAIKLIDLVVSGLGVH